MKMATKILGILCVLGLARLFVDGAIQHANITVKLCAAKYAFKFRVTSTVREECLYFSNPQSVMTTDGPMTSSSEITSAPTIATTDDPTQQTTPDNNNTPTSLQPNTFPNSTTKSVSTHVPSEVQSEGTTDQAETTSEDRVLSTSTPATTVQFSTTSFSTIPQPSTDNPDTVTSQSTPNIATSLVEEATSSTEPTTNVFVSSTTEKPLADVGAALSNTNRDIAGKKPSKRDCQFTAGYQEIKIVKKHIFKGNKEIKNMKRVRSMGENSYNSIIRLGVNFGQKLKKGHYFYLGKAISRSKDEDYVFMANLYNIVPWNEVRQKHKRSSLEKLSKPC